MYQTLDVFFFLFHTALIAFVLLGWIWRKTRRVHLAVVLLTAFSWFGLGLWYGFGYCPCTDWHWQVRARLGDHDLPYSYTKFLVDAATGWDWNETLVDVATVAALFVSLGLSLYANLRQPKTGP